WHNPKHVITRAQQFLSGSRYELTIASTQSRLELISAIRHRIAHSQKHTELKFDQATMTLSGKRYPKSRPGRFLRDTVPGSNPPVRWIAKLSQELASLSYQICS